MQPSDWQIIDGLPPLPPRKPDSNKGTFGRVLVIAGSRGMSGAAVLSASAALRAGAGLVRLAVPAEVQPLAATANPCLMTEGWPQDAAGRFAALTPRELALRTAGNDVIALGPGLGRSRGLTLLVQNLLAQWTKPLVLDADGLNNLAADGGALGAHGGPVVITPHPGEFARLLQTDVASVQAQRRESAANYARQHGVVVVLKGHATVVTDGRQLFVNATGNPGMATAGSGDVLSGVLAALLAQGLAPFAAACCAVHCHGLAGDLAAAARGQVGLIATDLLDYLPAALRQQAGA
ncbi:MAG: NAD(P)H-hydrate dehydratase [Gemmataceae bacterium]|nr:NAD(P)H-hydrate dehydratase [Gemmataceae bacterium]